MKTKTNSGDRILWFFLAIVLWIFAIKITLAQPNSTDVLKLKIIGNGYSDETFVRFLNGGSTNFDGNNDAWKMFSMNPIVPMIFTKVDGSGVCLNTFPPLQDKLKMDVFTRINSAGNYTIETKIISPFSPSVGIFLFDKISNQFHDIRVDSVLNVNLAADSGNTARFELFFSTPAYYSVSNLTCFKNRDGEIILENLSETGWQMEITDENNVFHKTDSGTTTEYKVPGLAGGIYTVVVSDFSGMDSFQIKVDQPYPVLSMFETSAETICICDGGNVDFYNNSTGATNYEWDFGDSAKSNQFQPKHSYSHEGEYVVSLVVTDGQCGDTTYKKINVVENYALATHNAGIKEEGVKVYFDGNNYVINTNSNGTQCITVEAFNLLGQKIFTAEKMKVQKQNLSINLGEYYNQPVLFSIHIGDKVISKIVY